MAGVLSGPRLNPVTRLMPSWGNLAAVARTAWLALVLAAAACPANVLAERLLCPGTDISVSHSDAADADSACQAAAYSIAFLESNGYTRGGGFEMQIVDRLPPENIPHSLGSLDHRNRQIRVLSFAEVSRGQKSILGLPADRELYRSLIAHEVAHLIALRNFSFDRPTMVAQEYIAGVTQIATLPSELRQVILTLYPGDGFRSTAAINLTLFLFDPHFFAVQAYRHFSRPENGATFLRALLLVRGLVSD